MQPDQRPIQSRANRLSRSRVSGRKGSFGLVKLAFAVGALLLLAYFAGGTTSDHQDIAQRHVPAMAGATVAQPVHAQTQGEPVVIHGEKSGTLSVIDDARMTVTDSGSVLRIEGSVGRNFATQLDTLLQASPSLQRIDITSGGGYAVSGLAAARLIRARNLIVRVRSHCASMCVVLWAAGAQRQMEPDAVIGLHAWNPQCDALPSPAREECRYQIQFASEHITSSEAWLRDAGFNKRLLDLQKNTAAENIAVVTVPQLWDNGVDFSAVDADGNRMREDQVRQYLAGRHLRQ